ncbi:GNAT family N-acetyltransferase [Estrella lausannensis]|uniref:Acetyltransferase, GNAT family n=1 Tax=Estrella lausannensis TaxID=483423 RepID=A0A0H5DPS7_9BACT|nr:GNAT family N-acetyltransferase [Estrella lausannensis]CRX37509.1 Acetyltransferase, GNAT family [Estrella lausannensis]
MKKCVLVRRYEPHDAAALAEIYYNTIHTVNSRDYTKEQIDAWAPPKSLDAARWGEKFAKTNPFVALIDGQAVGFAEFEPDGHIDCFYCHHQFLGRGVGKALMEAITQEAVRNSIPRLFAEVSITAKPFFERMGFDTLYQQTVEIKGIKLINFKMARPI